MMNYDSIAERSAMAGSTPHLDYAAMASKAKNVVVPFRVSPMLATLTDHPPENSHWVYEEKYDGIRIVAYREGGKVSLLSRNGIDRTANFAEIATALAKLKVQSACLDGEIVVFDAKNVSKFQLLQQGRGQPKYIVYDCLYLDGHDLRNETLALRRAAVEHVVKPSTVLLISATLGRTGAEAFQIAKRRGLEGIVAKRLDSRYVERRSSEWLKIKVSQEQEFVIGGFTAPSGAREHFGALLLGVYDRGKLQYVGKVGTGFNHKLLASLYRGFQPLIQKHSPFASEVKERNVTYISPKLVAQVSFTEWTSDGRLRQPVFLGLRDDKKPAEVRRERPK